MAAQNILSKSNQIRCERETSFAPHKKIRRWKSFHTYTHAAALNLYRKPKNTKKITNMMMKWNACVRRRRHHITQATHILLMTYSIIYIHICMHICKDWNIFWTDREPNNNNGLICAATCGAKICIWWGARKKKHERFGMCTPRGTLNMLFSTCMCARRCDEKIVYLYVYNKGHCEVPVCVRRV